MEHLDETRCELCWTTSTLYKPLRFCSQCGLAAYCGPEHQQQDWKQHKSFCNSLKKLRATIAKEERKLRDAPLDSICPGRVFDDGVGHFWELPETKSFILTRMLAVRSISALTTRQAIERSLADAMECLRLNRKDNLRFREAVPSFLLQLGKVQECYDFIRYYASPGAEWSKPKTPFLPAQNGDMLMDDISVFQGTNSVFMWGAITFIKMTLDNILEDAIKARTFAGASLRQSSDQAMLLATLLRANGFQTVQAVPVERLCNWHMMTRVQVIQAFQQTNQCNNNYWKAMVNPQAFIDQDGSCVCTRDCPYELTSWLANNAAIWQPFHGFIYTMQRMVA